MGGIGSGRHFRQDVKETTDDYCKLDIRYLRRKGLLTPGLGYSIQWKRNDVTIGDIKLKINQDNLNLDYWQKTRNNEWINKCHTVNLVWTPCTYGGSRAWFLCPIVNCRRRVAILYIGEISACRHCHQLVYTSQRETDFDRSIRQVDKIREKLKWESGFLNGGGWKPKGMHWRTFERLKAQHDALVETTMAEINRRFKQ